AGHLRGGLLLSRPGRRAEREVHLAGQRRIAGDAGTDHLGDRVRRGQRGAGGLLRVDGLLGADGSGGRGHRRRIRRHPLRRFALGLRRPGPDLPRPHPPRCEDHHRRTDRRTGMTTPAITVTEATVHYGQVLALDRASLTLEAGRICGLVGMNGSGKSTLFKTIMGIVEPDSGHVSVNGTTPARARRAGLLGYVPQSEDVDWDFPVSVREVVMMGRYGHMG